MHSLFSILENIELFLILTFLKNPGIVPAFQEIFCTFLSDKFNICCNSCVNLLYCKTGNDGSARNPLFKVVLVNLDCKSG